MGVKECSRKGCENIMCDEYSEVTGYICYECKSELEASNPNCIKDVETFMEYTKEDRYEDADGFRLDLLFRKE